MFDLVGFGAAHWDVLTTLHDGPVLGSSNPARQQIIAGGVCRNVVSSLARLGLSTAIVSRVGADRDGDTLIGDLKNTGVCTDWVSKSRINPTGSYSAVLDPGGNLIIGCAIMDVYCELDSRAVIGPAAELCDAEWWFADANLEAETIFAIASFTGRPPLAVDAVSVSKSKNIASVLHLVDLLFCNQDEAREILRLQSAGDAVGCGGDLTPVQMAEQLLALGIRKVVLTCGADGVVYGDGPVARSLAPGVVDVADVTGAGDALIAGVLFSLIGGGSFQAAVAFGQAAAGLAVMEVGADVDLQVSNVVNFAARRRENL